MKLFGDRNIFAIEYEKFPAEKNDEDLFMQLQGEMILYVDGLNICRYACEGSESNFQGVLYYIIEWICEHLFDILSYDPYPLPVDGSNLLDLIGNADNCTIGDEDEEYLWRASESNWLFRHSWRSVSETIIPQVFFRRINNDLEVSWDNEPWSEKNIAFLYPRGSKTMPVSYFKNVMMSFLKDILGNVTIPSVKDKETIGAWIDNIELLDSNFSIVLKVTGENQ